MTTFTLPCLTITQPWATLIAIGAKKIETRGWATKHVGWLGIHAAKGLETLRPLYEPDERGRRPKGPIALNRMCAEPPFFDALATNGVTDPAQLPLGAVIAVANLQRCTVMTDESIAALEERNPREAAFGYYAPGRVAWVLTEVHPLDEPYTVPGRQQVWEPPRFVGAEIMRRAGLATGVPA